MLGGNALLPVCMMDSVNRFAPGGHRPVGGALTMAQKLAAGNAASYAKPEQEDAQEFLSFLLVHAHEVRAAPYTPRVFILSQMHRSVCSRGA